MNQGPKFPTNPRAQIFTGFSGGHKHQQGGKRSRVSKADLEFALTILLVELASSDEGFAQAEYNCIMVGMKRVFGTDRFAVQQHINRAVVTLQNLRGTSDYAKLLKENLDRPRLEAVLQAVDDVINADGVQDGFEIYHRQRFARLLGIEEPPPLPETK